MIFSLSTLLAVSSFVSANMIKNGNFDDTTTAFCGKAWCPLLKDETPIRPWTITSPYKTYELHGGRTAFGDWMVDLNSDGIDNPLNTYGQTVETVKEQKYQVSFQLNANRDCALDWTDKTGFIRATGSDQQDFTYSEAAYGHKWVQIDYLFKATEDSTLIEIGSSSMNTNCGPTITAVSMLPVGRCSAGALSSQKIIEAERHDYRS